MRLAKAARETKAETPLQRAQRLQREEGECSHTTSIGLGGLVFYFKFIRSGDTLQMHLSSDGEHWWLRITVSIAAFLVAVDQVGIAFGAGGGSRPTLMCDWIRRTA